MRSAPSDLEFKVSNQNKKNTLRMRKKGLILIVYHMSHMPQYVLDYMKAKSM